MSKFDRDIMEKIKNLYNCGPPLRQVDIARHIDVEPQTLNQGLSNKKDFFDITRMGLFYQSLKNSHNPCLKQFAKTFKQRIFYEAVESSCGESTAQLMSSASSALIVTDRTAMGDYVGILAMADSPLKRLTFVIYQPSITNAIDAIETWAYGRYGNYADILKVTIFERPGEPIADMLGIRVAEQFSAFIFEQERYFKMSRFGEQWLQRENESLADQQPAWSLLRSPDARVLERFRRTLMRRTEVPMHPDIDAFLKTKIAAYEADASASAYANHDYWSSLSVEVGAQYGAKLAKIFDDEVMWVILVD